MSQRSSESTSRDPKRFPWAPLWKHLHPPSKNSTSSLSLKVVSPQFFVNALRRYDRLSYFREDVVPLVANRISMQDTEMRQSPWSPVLTAGEPQTFGRGFDLWMRSPLTTNTWTGGLTFPGSLELGKKSVSFFGSNKCPYHPVSLRILTL